MEKNLEQGGKIIDELIGMARPRNKEELCQYLKIDRTTLEYYNGQGLPRFKLGNEIRYYIPDVLNFFRGRGVSSPKERFAHASEA